MKTGRDVIIGTLLGAEEFGFGTAPLVVLGCVMMRVCHLDTCPVGIATQNPELRKRFSGRPEYIETFFTFIAEEVREYLAALGFRTLDEAVGHVECLDVEPAVKHWKAAGLDLRPLLCRVEPYLGTTELHQVRVQDHGLDKALDNELIKLAGPALESGEPVKISLPVRNVHRTVGTMLGAEVTRRYGGEGLPPGTIGITLSGSGGQSFGAFIPAGVEIILYGDTNDYLAKGLSGGTVVVRPPVGAGFVAEENIIAGNVCAYGATGGELFISGQVGERFCVRNSGVTAVVEGVGDHGCEYMTGGRAVVLGPTGRNFAAGMSGGVAYVYDPEACSIDASTDRWSTSTRSTTGTGRSSQVIERHRELTGSELAARIIAACLPPSRSSRRSCRPTTGGCSRRPARRSRGRVGRRCGDGGGPWLTRVVSSSRRQAPSRRPVAERIHDWREVYQPFPGDRLRVQAARCMDCGIPFCHQGCPLGNLIPEWNDLVCRGDMAQAADRLHATNNFPEFTGRLCPAPCEGACVLGINAEPVSIKQVEFEISEWVTADLQPQLLSPATGRRVAVVGSGPAGLAAAQQLTRAGHEVTVYERAERSGASSATGCRSSSWGKR